MSYRVQLTGIYCLVFFIKDVLSCSTNWYILSNLLYQGCLESIYQLVEHDKTSLKLVEHDKTSLIKKAREYIPVS
jgi:hypothetical protein